MTTLIRHKKFSLFFRITAFFLIFSFSLSLILPSPGYAQAVLNLPPPGTMVTVSPPFDPAIVKGLTIHPDNPLRFDFIINRGDSRFTDDEFKEESRKLIKYFLASLTVPEDQMWVNLSPYEKERVIPDALGVTDMGRDLLAQDYLLKQLTASLVYPEDDLGKDFWSRVRLKAREMYGTSDIPMNTFNKVWIMPDKAAVYEYNGSVFVVKRHLKVMLEEDYVALFQNQRSQSTKHSAQNQQGFGTADGMQEGNATPLASRAQRGETGVSTSHMNTKDEGRRTKDVNRTSDVSRLTSDVVRNLVLPEIEREINEGEHFATLRQIFNSMILATWYKKNLKESLLGKVYMDQNKVKGIDLEDKETKQKIYERYVEAFKKGVYNYVKEDYDPQTRQLIPRKYFSGGIVVGAVSVSDLAILTGEPADQAMVVREAVLERPELDERVEFVLAEIGSAASGTVSLADLVRASESTAVPAASTDAAMAAEGNPSEKWDQTKTIAPERSETFALPTDQLVTFKIHQPDDESRALFLTLRLMEDGKVFVQLWQYLGQQKETKKFHIGDTRVFYVIRQKIFPDIKLRIEKVWSDGEASTFTVSNESSVSFAVAIRSESFEEDPAMTTAAEDAAMAVEEQSQGVDEAMISTSPGDQNMEKIIRALQNQALEVVAGSEVPEEEAQAAIPRIHRSAKWSHYDTLMISRREQLVFVRHKEIGQLVGYAQIDTNGYLAFVATDREATDQNGEKINGVGFRIMMEAMITAKQQGHLTLNLNYRGTEQGPGGFYRYVARFIPVARHEDTGQTYQNNGDPMMVMQYELGQFDPFAGDVDRADAIAFGVTMPMETTGDGRDEVTTEGGVEYLTNADLERLLSGELEPESPLAEASEYVIIENGDRAMAGENESPAPEKFVVQSSMSSVSHDDMLRVYSLLVNRFEAATTATISANAAEVAKELGLPLQTVRGIFQRYRMSDREGNNFDGFSGLLGVRGSPFDDPFDVGSLSHRPADEAMVGDSSANSVGIQYDSTAPQPAVIALSDTRFFGDPSVEQTSVPVFGEITASTEDVSSDASLEIGATFSDSKSKNVGGINLDAGMLDLQIERDGNGVPLPVFQQHFETMSIDGFLPIIINVAPINVPMLLGISTESPTPAPEDRNTAQDHPPSLSALPIDPKDIPGAARL